MAGATRLKRRHWALLASFILIVLVPIGATAFYLWTIATDQYESRVGFSVRAEETKSPLDVLGGITGLSSVSSSDTDILYEFIQSQEMVARVDERLGLRAIYGKPQDDPVFALKEGSSIEDLVGYWSRMVRIYYDSGTGLIEVRAYAFDPTDAQSIARAIFDESNEMINALSAIARTDTTRYAEQELTTSVERLIAARQTITAFRNRTQIVDPSVDAAAQMGLLNTLQTQLAETMIEYDMLSRTTRENDPRLEQARLEIAVIEARIAQERRKFGVTSGEAGGFAELLAEFERLQVDLEFAEQAYISARSAYDAATAEAQRRSRYLAAYLQPTLAETSTAPRRFLNLATIGGFLFIAWAIGALIYYSLRDMR